MRKKEFIRSPFQFLGRLVSLLSRLILITAVIAPVIFGIFVYIKGNEPMGEVGNLGEMTYWEFMADRWQAVEESPPERGCKGITAYFVAVDFVFSTLHTLRALWPNFQLWEVDSVSELPIVGQERLSIQFPIRWYEVPNVWWEIFKLESWEGFGHSLTKPVNLRSPNICYLPPVGQ